MKKVVYLDLDDFSEKNNRLDWLWMLKKEFPDFRVNVFIPFFSTTLPFEEYIDHLGWIQRCLHGSHHKKNEDVEEKLLIDATENWEFAKIYRAPYWQLSDKMYDRLKKLDFKIMLHPDDPREGIKYNWNIKDSPPPLDILYGHGHVQDVCGNGIEESLENIMKLPKDTEFRFL